MFTENLAAYLPDFGVSVTWQTQTALALFDKPDTDILSKRVQTRGYKITFPATQFAGIKRADAVVIASVSYSVLEVNSLDDGSFYCAELQAV